MPYPYEILEIPENANQQQIRKAYLNKIRQYPPEKYPDKFARITAANELIINEVARAKLKFFGLPGIDSDTKFCELIEKDNSRRIKIGVKAWMNILKKGQE